VLDVTILAFVKKIKKIQRWIDTVTFILLNISVVYKITSFFLNILKTKIDYLSNILSYTEGFGNCWFEKGAKERKDYPLHELSKRWPMLTRICVGGVMDMFKERMKIRIRRSPLLSPGSPFLGNHGNHKFLSNFFQRRPWIEMLAFTFIATKWKCDPSSITHQ